MEEALLIIGVFFTGGHVVLDLANFKQHMSEPRCVMSLLGVVFLVGHVLLTGEAATWVRALL